MLKLVRRPKSPNWIMRGTVRGQSIEESTGVTDRKVAEEIRAKRENEILTRSVWGTAATMGKQVMTYPAFIASFLSGMSIERQVHGSCGL